ncbi:Polyphosphate kinase 2 [Hyphomicrobium sulfonivorans]|uniref:ADP/GDP-polyphosphate phosphotransferase n=1 Tax=Hyphomicrobium sulfonivorans TaxID=121290 RepID=A0A109BLU9_HYPSL|nr:polyphosphate kinase 2 [Hyphomicrobium sulfonivorans]KWT70910.1 Polyphosphate kinase 2 [Hyphomicrobium sulfonivorans]
MAKAGNKGKNKGSEDATSQPSSDDAELACSFDINNPVLPPAIADHALTSGGFPYDSELKKKPYGEELTELQLELLKLQSHIQQQGQRFIALFEGRDASGKGSCIRRFMERLNSRHARSVALSKPNEEERGQWYFQRYVRHFPTAGDMVLFDRSWYNRAGVERVMNFCTPEQTENFLRDVPDFEALLVRDGIQLFKFHLIIGREMQLVRFHERRHNPFKRWKITDVDLAAIDKWDDYTRAQNEIFARTSSELAPWIIVRANDQRRARLETIRWVLFHSDYPDKDAKAVGTPDPKIIGIGPEYYRQP